MDDVKEKAGAVVDQAADLVDRGVQQTVEVLRPAAGVVLARAQELWETAQASVGYAEQLQDQAFDTLKGGVEYALLHPQYTYPAAAALVLTAVPPLRRLAYRLTLGRLRNPEAVVASSEAKLASLAARAEEYGAEATKLRERAALASEEMARGCSKLRAARQELQRLEGSVAKSERVAHGVLGELRAMRQNTRATELRSEVAVQLSSLQQQRRVLQKEIWRIVKQDV